MAADEQDQTQQMRMLDDLVVTAPTASELRRAGILGMSQLIQKSEKQLVALNVSKKSILEIKDVLGGMGLALAPESE
jgi:DNA-directed RNA polymerase subunit alpha